MILPPDVLQSESAKVALIALALPALGPVLKLVLVTGESIVQVVLLSVVGYVLAHQGILNKDTQRRLNRLNVSIFTPALLFSKVAFSLSPERLTQLMIVPFGFVLVSIASALAAHLCSWVLRLPAGQRHFVVACAITPNSNTLPVAIMQSLVDTLPELHWPQNGIDEDNPDEMLGRALTYLILFSTLGMVLRWSVAAKLLNEVSTDLPDDPAAANPPTGEHAPSRYRDEPEEHQGEAPPRDHTQSPETLPAPGDVPASMRARTFADKYIKGPFRAFLEFMSVPLWAALLSFVVALIPPLQHLVSSVTPLVGALRQAGACSIPLTILVLGSYFHEDSSGPSGVPPTIENVTVRHPQALRRSSQSFSTAEVPPPPPPPPLPDFTWRTVMAAVASRMIVTPLLLLPLLAYACIYSNQHVMDDPVFLTSACLIIGSPPALTLAQITAKMGRKNSNVEQLISGTIFVSYMFLAAPTTILLVLFALFLDEKQAMLRSTLAGTVQRFMT